MSSFLPTIILRHRKENLKKCSLRGLETRLDLRFYTYPNFFEKNQIDHLFSEVPVKNYLLFDLSAPPLTKNDAHLGLFLVDGTWKYAKTMHQRLPPFIEKRSLPPHFRTAYPRYQTDCPDEERGLASVEALFIAYHILERKTDGLLDLYHWKLPFLEKNNLL